MAILSATLSNLSYFHQGFPAPDDTESFVQGGRAADQQGADDRRFLRYRRSQGLPFIYPDPHLRYAANFLHMMFSLPYKQYIVTPEIEDALNLMFILHADHEQNCSTSTVRAVGSARANLFASCAAGVCALWGPLHGGANVEVMKMLERIHDGGMSARRMHPRAPRTRTIRFRLYGFGHRVYRNYDPRAKILKAACDRVLATLQAQGPAAGHRPKARRAGPGGSLLRRAQALSERRFLQRHPPAGDRHSDQHVHGVFRHRPAAGLDRPMEGAARGPDDQNLPPPADLRRPERDALRTHRRAMTTAPLHFLSHRNSPGRSGRLPR